MTSKQCQGDTEDDIARIFDMYDQDKKGWIDINDLKEVAEELNEALDEKSFEMMLEKIGSRDGRITEDDFMMFNKSFGYKKV